MTTRTSTYPLRLPVSIKREAEQLSAAEGTSLNQFVATAVAEKVAALRAASHFAERRGGADWEAFDRLMQRPRGEPPRAGDELTGQLLGRGPSPLPSPRGRGSQERE